MAILSYNGKRLSVSPGHIIKFLPQVIAPKTMRFDFKYDHFDPTTLTDNGRIGATWTHVEADVYDFYFDNINWGRRIWQHLGTLEGGLFNTYGYREGSSSYVFPMAQHQYDLIDLNLEGVIDVSELIASAWRVQNIVSIRNSGSVVNFNTFLSHNNRSLAYRSIPLFDTSSAVDVGSMCRNATGVETGALALYTQMSTQANPPSITADCFSRCGRNTTTGAAELAQIPASWGGTGA